MEPYVRAAYLAGLRDAVRVGRMPPPGCDKSSQKSRRRREPSKQPTVPSSPALALGPLTVEQMRNDLEVHGLQRELADWPRLTDLDGKQGAEVDELWAKKQKRLQELKPQQMSGPAVIQRFNTHFQAQGQLLSLAFDKEGCRLVQAMLEYADLGTTKRICRELAPAVQDMAKSPHANYVVTKMIEVAPPESVCRVIPHLSGHAEQIARHRYGCRIICRLLERSSKSKLPGLEGLLEEVLLKAQALCCHIFAHHVIQSVLENSPQHEHRQKIVEALCADLQRCAQDRHASFVIQAALKRCRGMDVVRILTDRLIGMLLDLATTRFGSYVCNILCAQESTTSEAIAALKKAAPSLQGSTHGMKLVRQFLAQEGCAVAAGKHAWHEA